MRTALKDGSKFLLNCEDQSGDIWVEIIETLGSGIDCIAYEVSYGQNINGKTYVFSGLLKEFYPSNTDEEQLHITRSEDGKLQVSPGHYSSFQSKKKIFLKKCETISSFYFNDETTDNNSKEIHILTANNTVYILYSYDAGNNYESFKESSMDEIIKNAISITKSISVYHDNKYLHLKIMPSNVVFTDIKDHTIKMFDFGSAISFEEINTSSLQEISYSAQLSAPELLSLSIDEIGPSTDIFSIGAIIFYRIMHRYPEEHELDNFSECSFDKEDVIFKNISPSIYRKLKTLFEKTLCKSPQNRYKTCSELIDGLNTVLKISSPMLPYLVGNIDSNYILNNVFVGRKKEMISIDEMLSKNNIAILNGVGGIGKTELAKYYGATRKFDTVYCAKFKNSIKEFIIAMPFANMNDSEWLLASNGEKDDTNLYKKKKEMFSSFDEHTLIIIDDFSYTDDISFDILSKCGVKIIITTRFEIPTMDQYKVCISSLDFVDAKELFSAYCDEKVDDEEFEKLFALIRGSTLLIKLISCAIKKSNGMLSVGEFTGRMDVNSIENIGDSVQNNDEFNDSIMRESIYMHLKILFNVTDVTVDQVDILKDLSLLCIDELTVNEYSEIKGVKTFEVMVAINDLVEKGLIQNDDGCLHIHPLISDLILEDNSTKPSDEKIEQLALSAKTYLRKIDMEEWGKFKKILEIFVSCAKRISFHSDKFLDELNNEIQEAFKNGCINECRSLIDITIKYSALDSDEGKMSYALFNALLSLCDALEGKMSSANKYQEKIDNTLKSVDVMKYPLELAMIFYYMAFYYRCTTNYKKALEYHEAYVKLKKKYDISNFNDVDSEIVAGAIYLSDGKYLSAIERFKNIEKSLGGSKGKNATQYRIVNNLNLALAYLSLSDYETALKYCKKAETDPSFSYNSPYGHLLYNHLVLIYMELNMLEQAQEYSDLEIETAELIHGNESSQYYLAVVNHAQVLFKNKKIDEATQILDNVISILNAKNQENTEELAAAYNLKGLIHMNLGKLEDAAKNLKISSGIRKDIYGDKHPNVIISYANVGLLYAELGRFELAEQNLKQALFMCENSEISNTIINARVYNCIGKTYLYMKRYSDAIDYYTRALNVKKALFGHYHFEIVNGFENLAIVYEAAGNVDEAIKLRGQIEYIASKANVSIDRLIRNYVYLSTLLIKCGKLDDALEICEKAKRLGEYSGIEQIYNNIGTICFEREEYDETLKNYKKALSYKTQENEASFGIINVNMGVLGLVLECYDEALDYFEEGIYLYDKYGIDDFNAFVAFVRCGECNYWAEKYENAIEVCKRAEALYLDGKIAFDSLLNLAYEIISESYDKLGDRYNSKEYRNKMRS